MTTFLNILFLIIGMVLLIKGADFFVDGASAVARKFKIPSFIIGLTIVAIGTSLPELSISLSSSIAGTSDMTLGNIIGSNLANLLLILGSASVFSTIKISKSNTKTEIGFLIVLTSALLLFSADNLFNNEENLINRTESIILVALFSFYMTTTIRTALKNKVNNQNKQQKNISEEIINEEKSNLNDVKPEKELSIWRIIIYIILGLGAVVFGGECVCSTAQYLALKLGMSEALVGLTVVAIGTSLPELVTSIVAAKKRENEIAFGNVIGSNISNIGLVLGLSGTLTTTPVSNVILTDLIILFILTTISSIVIIRKKEINKVFGFILVLTYVLYLTFAIVRNYCL